MENLVKYHKNILSIQDFKFSRSYSDTIAWNERLIGIMGFKGVGKTMLMMQHIIEKYGIDNPSCLYVNMDNINFPFNTLAEMAERFYVTGGDRLFIDEIHKYPGWSKELKHLYDHFPKLKIVFSGSSILLLQLGRADLSRRAVMYKLKGLSFREYLQIELNKKFKVYPLKEIIENGDKITTELNKQFRPFAYFENYLKHGYFPYFLESKATYPIKLNTSISQVIESEIPLISNIDVQHIAKMKRFVYYLASHVPYTLNITKLAEAFQVSRQTILHYIQYLKDTEVLNFSHATSSMYGKLTKPEKILLHNPNLCFSLSNEPVDAGTLRETFFMNQLAGMHEIEIPLKGDFLIDGKYIFEIGGRSKTSEQIKGLKNAYIVKDDVEYASKGIIPLWLFGFLY